MSAVGNRMFLTKRDDQLTLLNANINLSGRSGSPGDRCDEKRAAQCTIVAPEKRCIRPCDVERHVDVGWGMEPLLHYHFIPAAGILNFVCPKNHTNYAKRFA